MRRQKSRRDDSGQTWETYNRNEGRERDGDEQIGGETRLHMREKGDAYRVAVKGETNLTRPDLSVEQQLYV